MTGERVLRDGGGRVSRDLVGEGCHVTCGGGGGGYIYLSLS